LTRSTIQRLRLLALMVATAAAVGGFYAVTRTPPSSSWAVQLATGATIGAVISSCIIGFDLFGEAWMFERGGRRLPLGAAILWRTIVYGVVIMAALLIFPWLYSGAELSPFRPGIVGDIVFSIAATFVFVSLTSIIQVIGPSVLGSLLTGRYYHPRQEERIVLFLDLVGSTGIAERIGNVRFHALLSETFTRLARVVTDFGGDVHRYVGDALIATWPLRTPEENARPIRCLFACRGALEAARPDLLHRHGHVPGFRASLHSGPLVAGEIGGFKREIALVGNAMNTAARLEQACRTTGHAFLASKPLLDCTLMPGGIVATSIGSHLLRGKAEGLELFALERDPQRRIDRDHDVARAFAVQIGGSASTALTRGSSTSRRNGLAGESIGSSCSVRARPVVTLAVQKSVAQPRPPADISGNVGGIKWSEQAKLKCARLDGSWIHRLLVANGIESHVVEPASIAVPRRHRRTKTDAVDGETFQPMNVNFGLLPPLGRAVKRAERKPALARRALADLAARLGSAAQAA
jgi:adenylate cyclase